MLAVSWVLSRVGYWRRLERLRPPLDRLEEDRFVRNLTPDGTFSTKYCLPTGSRERESGAW
jgi:hypothetical protein